MFMNAIQVPTSFYADLKVKENVQSGKSWGKDWNILGLEINGKQIFYPLNIGKYSKLRPDCCKMALFAVQFSKI